MLTRALMDAVGAGLAQRAAAAVEQAAKPKRIKKHDAPQDRPNNFAGTTGAAAAAHLEKRDKQREDDRSADAQKKAKAQAKRDAKKAAEEAKLKENAVVALKVLIAHAGRLSSTRPPACAVEQEPVMELLRSGTPEANGEPPSY